MTSRITPKKLYNIFHPINITDLTLSNETGVHLNRVSEMKVWISQNKTDDVYLYNGQFWFESELDRTNFLIAWK